MIKGVLLKEQLYGDKRPLSLSITKELLAVEYPIAEYIEQQTNNSKSSFMFLLVMFAMTMFLL